MCEHARSNDARPLEARASHAVACRDCRVELLAERAIPFGCREPLLGHRVLRYLDALAEGRAVPEELRAHIGRCPACRLEVRDAAEALTKLRVPAPARLLEGPAQAPALGLVCQGCRGRLVRAELVRCASCRAAHHPECFAELERCAAPGCTDRRFVRSLPGERTSRRLGPGRWFLGGLIGLVVSAGTMGEVRAQARGEPVDARTNAALGRTSSSSRPTPLRFASRLGAWDRTPGREYLSLAG